METVISKVNYANELVIGQEYTVLSIESTEFYTEPYFLVKIINNIGDEYWYPRTFFNNYKAIYV